MDHLFVYGTLRHGSHNEFARMLADRALLVGAARVPGRLCDFGPYPGAVPSDGPDQWIHGEIHQFEDRELLPSLDEYEGAEFARERASVQMENGVDRLLDLLVCGCAGRPRDCFRRLAKTLVQEIRAVQRVALLGDEAGVANQPPQFLFASRDGARPPRDTTFSSIMMLPTSLPPKRRPNLAGLQPGRHPRRLNVQDVFEIKPRERQHLQILHRRRFLLHEPAERRVLALEATTG